MPARDLFIHDHLTIPGDLLEVAFTRSSGPGGQNVNKVNSRAELRFFLEQCTLLSGSVVARLKALVGKRLTQDGVIILVSQRHRDQARNLDDCYDKLQHLIRTALLPPTPRYDTAPTRSSVHRRIGEKKHRARVKQGRSSGHSDD